MPMTDQGSVPGIHQRFAWLSTTYRGADRLFTDKRALHRHNRFHDTKHDSTALDERPKGKQSEQAWNTIRLRALGFIDAWDGTEDDRPLKAFSTSMKVES